MILVTKTSDQARHRVCVCVFIKLHITAQSGPVIYSFYATACNPPESYLSYCVCVCVFIKLHITAQSGPVIYSYYPALSSYSFYATRVDPPKGGSMILVTKISDQGVCVCVCVYLLNCT